MFGGRDQETVDNHVTKADKDLKDVLYYASIGGLVVITVHIHICKKHSDAGYKLMDRLVFIDTHDIHLLLWGDNALSTIFFSYVQTFIHETED